MLDTPRKPFDISTTPLHAEGLEGEMEALLGRGARDLDEAPLPRRYARADSGGAQPTAADYSEVATSATEASAVDVVNHPPHYTSHPSGVECIQITEWMNFNLGNAVKYIWRAGQKPTSATIQDLEKAQWYLAREINRLGSL